MAGKVRPLLIIGLWMYTIYVLPRIKNQIPRFKLLIKCFVIIMFLSGFSALRSWSIGIHFGAIVYTLLQTQGFYSLVFFFSHISRSKALVQRTLWVCLISSCLLGVGIIIDALFGFSNFFMIPGLEMIDRYELSGMRRGNFLVGTNMAFISLSIGLVSAYLLLVKLREKRIVLVLNLMIGIVVGMYMTFSRASSILGGIFCLFIIFKIIVFEKIRVSKFRLVFILLIVCFCFSPKIISVTPDRMYEKYYSMLYSYGAGNQSRINSWERGFSLFKNPDRWWGYGLGTSNPRMQSLFGSPYMGHYESGIFLTFSEAGISGILALFLPFAIVFYYTLRKKTDYIFIVWALLLILNLFVSPSITGYNTPMIIYSFLGLFLIFLHSGGNKKTRFVSKMLKVSSKKII